MNMAWAIGIAAGVVFFVKLFQALAEPVFIPLIKSFTFMASAIVFLGSAIWETIRKK